MNRKIDFAVITGIVLVLAFAVSLTQIDNQATAQETTPFPSREKVISVTGTATASVDPDLLVIQFGVETQEKTARQALESKHYKIWEECFDEMIKSYEKEAKDGKEVIERLEVVEKVLRG